MAKIGLTKLGLKKNTNLITLNWNDQIIEIKEYLPIEEKIGVIEKIVNSSLDDNNFANPARVTISTVLEIMYAYTNINFTDKQKEDRLGLYDLLVGSQLWAEVRNQMVQHSGDLFEIESTVKAVIDEVYKYKNSVLGILQAVSEDYENLNLDAEAIQKKLGDKENVEFLKTVVDKLG